MISLIKKMAICLLSLLLNEVSGQTPNFRLPLVNTHALNPSLIGFGHFDNYQAARFQTSLKAQWVGINKRLATSSLSYDMSNKGNSSWGVNVTTTDFMSNRQGQKTEYNHLAAQLAYAYLINGKKVNWKFGLALQGSNYQFGNTNFIWGDQINSDFTAFTNPTQEPLENQNVNSIQASVGLLAFGEKWFVGVSLHNINEPNIAFFSNSTQPLYRRINIHAGLKIKKDFSNTSFTPTLSYSNQYQTQQYAFDAIFQNGNVYYGVGGFTSKLNENLAHSLHTFFTVRKNQWGIGYDLDLNLTLNPSNPVLTHEFNLIYLLKSKSNRKAVFANLPIL
jgi:type IX secretion system PorP/SprF family membrane protein